MSCRFVRGGGVTDFSQRATDFLFFVGHPSPRKAKTPVPTHTVLYKMDRASLASCSAPCDRPLRSSDQSCDGLEREVRDARQDAVVRTVDNDIVGIHDTSSHRRKNRTCVATGEPQPACNVETAMSCNGQSSLSSRAPACSIRAMSRPWGEHEPTTAFLLEVLLVLCFIAVACSAVFKQAESPAALLHKSGVSMKRVARAVREVERKMFHICLLLAPLIQNTLLQLGWSNRDCKKLVWTIAALTCSMDMLRLHSPLVKRLLDSAGAGRIMRPHEASQLTGGFYMGIGVALTMTISPPSISTTALLFLVLGDMSAAIIGVSFGGEVAVVKLGRTGKKSLEGSTAMFLVCLAIGCVTFSGVTLREYAIFFGALAATLTELYEPMGLNDNLTIPVISSLAMQWGFNRISACHTQGLVDALANHGIRSLDGALELAREAVGSMLGSDGPMGALLSSPSPPPLRPRFLGIF